MHGQKVIREMAQRSASYIPLVMLMMSQWVYAQQQGLVLEISAAKTPVVIGEPVYLIIQLRNTGDRTQPVFPALASSAGLLTISITDPNGSSRPFLPLSLGEGDMSTVDLQPGEALTEIQPIFFGGRGWTFQQEGQYRISASFIFSDTGEVRAMPIGLEVVTGDGAGDFMLSNEDAALEAGKFLLWRGGDHLQGGIALLEQVNSNFPASPIGDHFQFAMATSLSEPFRNFASGVVREAQAAQASDALARVDAADVPAALYAARSLLGARLAEAQGMDNERGRYLADARDAIVGDELLQALFEDAIDAASAQ